MTEAGRKLEAALPAELKSVGLTAKWEMLCRRIERGEVTAENFLTVIRKFVVAVVADAKKRKASGQIATTPARVRQN
jgi:DNA topoisomerase IA